jgi:hypothetical protein
MMSRLTASFWKGWSHCPRTYRSNLVRNICYYSDMTDLVKYITKRFAGFPEGKNITAKELLHFGNRAAVDQALSRLTRSGHLLRVSRGLYVRPVEGRFGARPPVAAKTVESLGSQRGETVVRHGAATANALGLTTQVPLREVYLTSGRSRELKLGAQVVELRHAPAWQLVLPGSIAGDVVRALAWLGEERAKPAGEILAGKLSESERDILLATRGRLPTWIARQVSGFPSHG